MGQCDVCGQMNWTVRLHASNLAPASTFYCLACDSMPAEPTGMLEPMVQDPNYFGWVDLSRFWTWEDGRYVPANDWLSRHGGAQRAAFPPARRRTPEEMAAALDEETLRRELDWAENSVIELTYRAERIAKVLVGLLVGDVASRFAHGAVADQDGTLRCSAGAVQALAFSEALARCAHVPDLRALRDAVLQEPIADRAPTDPLVSDLMRAVVAAVPYEDLEVCIAAATEASAILGAHGDPIAEDAVVPVARIARGYQWYPHLRRKLLRGISPSPLGDAIAHVTESLQKRGEDEPTDVLHRLAQGDERWPAWAQLQGTLAAVMVSAGHKPLAAGWTARVNAADLARADRVAAALVQNLIDIHLPSWQESLAFWQKVAELAQLPPRPEPSDDEQCA